jgi:hypothetical protein
MCGADAGRCHVDLSRVGLGIGDELGNRFGRDQRVHEDNHRHPDDAADRRDVADEIEIEFRIERGVDRVGDRGRQQRIAVRGRVDDGLGADVAAGAGPVLDDEGLAEPVTEPLRHQARRDDAAAAGGKTGHEAHRPRRIIGRRASVCREGRSDQRGPGQLEEVTAEKFHGKAAVP